MGMDRRRFVAAVGAGASLAGCLRLEGETDASSADRPSTFGTATATDTEEPSTGTETTGEGDALAPLSGTWPEFRGDGANTGAVPSIAGPGGSVAESWRTGLPDEIAAWSSPVVADGMAFVLADRGFVGALDTATGDPVWNQQFPADTDTVGSPAVADGTLYAGALDSSSFYAMNAASGAYQWETSLDAGSFASPTVADGLVYVATTTGRVYALSAADGSVRWEYDTGARTVLASPAFHDGRLYVVSTTPKELPSGVDDLFDLLYYDRFYRWGRIDEDPHATAAGLDAEATLHVLDGAAGDRVGGRQFPDFVVSTPTVADDGLFVSCWDGNVYALELGAGTERWVSGMDAPSSASPAVADGVLYCGDWRGNLHAFDVANGSRRWFVPVGSNVASSPAVADGTIYATGAGGGVVAVSTAGAIEWRFEGAEGNFHPSSPAVVDDALLVCGEVGGEESSQGGVFRLDAP